MDFWLPDLVKTAVVREIKAPEPVVMTSKSFDGMHEIQFNERSHRYKIDGKAAVGTTTFCKSGYPTSMGLVNWMKVESMRAMFSILSVPSGNEYRPNPKSWPQTEETLRSLIKICRDDHEKSSREAADIGTVCHAYAELHSLGKAEEAEKLLDQVRSVPKWPVIESCVSKYKDWAAQNHGKLVCAEGLIASPTYLFCGKFDRLDRVNGKLILRDYKTSKDIYVEQYVQLGAYSIAIKEWMGLDVEGLEVLRFGKEDGEFHTLLIDDASEIKMFQEQALRCLETHRFRKMESDPRFDWKKKKMEDSNEAD